MNVYSSHTHGGSLIVFRQHLLGGEFNEGGWGCAEEGFKSNERVEVVCDVFL